MSSRLKFCYQTIITLYLVKFLNALPATYCNFPINRTDCGRPPTPVFSYYKPGSRCEIEIWRGCPSYNRFDNEVTCKHFCIGKMNVESADPAEPNSDENEIVQTNYDHDHDNDPCVGDLNKDDCGGTPTSVYTYDRDKKSCVQAVWKGCATNNMFRNKAKCSEMCQKFGDFSMLAEKIEKLTPEQLEQLNAMLDEYLSKNEDNKKSALTGNTGPPAAAGDTGPTAAAGDTEPTAAAGDTEPKAAAGDTEPTAAAGDTEPTAAAGDTEPAAAAGDTEPTAAAGDTEPTADAGDTEPATAAGDTEP